MQTFTSHTTDGLAYYHADVQTVTRLSREEEARLIATLSPRAHAPSQEERQMRIHLLESHLPHIRNLALLLCPPGQGSLLPDIIG